MTAGTSGGTEQGHKTLAAIVFTDVVGFAHHANTDEQRALACLQRDMEIMKDVCARSNGTVLKTMGDGMLMRFPSAQQALVCALEIQRVFHEQAKLVKPTEVLWHRIGVHLGDVITTEDDVYGDGVNVAARLQAEAKPGSIYLSRTVYDVVRGKMKFPAVYVGPRHLKGIAEPVAVWEVQPLGRQELEKRQEALMAMNMPLANDAGGGIRGTKAGAVIVASLVLLAGASYMLITSMKRASAEKIAEGSGQQLHFKKEPPADSSATAGAAVTPAVDPNQTAPNTAKMDTVDPLTDPVLVAQLREQLARYDFAAMASAIGASPYSKGEAAKKLMDRYNRLNSFMGWLSNELDTTDSDHPITLTSDPAHGNVPATIYRVSAGFVAVKTATSSWTVAVNKLTPAELVAIAGVLEDMPGATETITKPDLDQDCKLLVGEPDALRAPAA